MVKYCCCLINTEHKDLLIFAHTSLKSVHSQVVKTIHLSYTADVFFMAICAYAVKLVLAKLFTYILCWMCNMYFRTSELVETALKVINISHLLAHKNLKLNVSEFVKGKLTWNHIYQTQPLCEPVVCWNSGKVYSTRCYLQPR